jgi:thiosulfate/3-mercaptopyruvate sulfurtransferase
MTAYAYDIGLITPEELQRDFSTWRLLDGRPQKMWKKSHIFGSRSFSWEDYTGIDEKKIPYRVLPPEKIAQALGDMGITEETPIVAYGDADQSWGGEAWICWVLTWLGHKAPVRLLSGGVDAWTASGRSLASTMEPESFPRRVYQFHERKECNVSTDFIVRLPENHVLVDTRSFREWITGSRLPGAVHIQWEKFYKGPHRIPIGSDDLKDLLKSNGISQNQRVIYYCTGGIRSSFAWMVHEIHMNGKALNYEGGTEAWDRRDRNSP